MKMKEMHFKSLESTNSHAKTYLVDYERDAITIITADEQSGGRGRFGARKWISPVGQGLLMTFAFFIQEELQDPLSLTHLLGLSVIDVLHAYNIEGKIKWPNDILVGEKKIAGILCETQHLPPHFGVALGLGLNVNMPQEVLESVGQPATSILQELKREVAVEDVKPEVIRIFLEKLEIFFAKGFAPFQNDFQKKLKIRKDS